MARRTVLLVVAVIIALVGAGLIVVYVKGIDARANSGQEVVTVLRATEVIEPGKDVATAMDEGKIAPAQIRVADQLSGALTEIESIQGQVALSTIYPGEQIISAKFGSLGETETLTIPESMVAVSVNLTDSARVAGFVNPGSEVALIVSKDNPEGLPYTQMLLPRVQVIAVGATTMTSSTTTSADGTQSVEQLPRTLITLAVSQQDAQRVIFAQRTGELAFMLLTKDSKTAPGGPVNDSNYVGAN